MRVPTSEPLSSQVWFQNRRTKWRKKSALEPSSSTPRAPGSAGAGGERAASETEDDEYNTLILVSTHILKQGSPTSRI